MGLHFVYDIDFKLPEHNPFSQRGSYEGNWVMLKLVDTDKFQMMTGTDRIFSFTLSKLCEGWQYRFMDYVNYQSEYMREIIIVCHRDDFHEAKSIYGASGIYDSALRRYEPNTLIHSTTSEAYKGICNDGFISSWNTLKRNGKNLRTKPDRKAVTRRSD